MSDAVVLWLTIRVEMKWASNSDDFYSKLTAFKCESTWETLPHQLGFKAWIQTGYSILRDWITYHYDK